MLRTTTPVRAVTAGPAGSAACADRATALWVSSNKDFWTQSCFLSSCFVCSLDPCLLSSLFQSRCYFHNTIAPFILCPGNQALSHSYSSFSSTCFCLFFFLATFMFPLHSTIVDRNLLTLNHNAARQDSFSNFLTWMLMIAGAATHQAAGKQSWNSACFRKLHHFLLSFGTEIKKSNWQVIWLGQGGREGRRARLNLFNFKLSDSYHLGNSTGYEAKWLLRDCFSDLEHRPSRRYR